MTYCKIAIVGLLHRQQLSLSIQLKISAKLVQAILLAKAMFEKRITLTTHRKDFDRAAVRIELRHQNVYGTKAEMPVNETHLTERAKPYVGRKRRARQQE